MSVVIDVFFDVGTKSFCRLDADSIEVVITPTKRESMISAERSTYAIEKVTYVFRRGLHDLLDSSSHHHRVSKKKKKKRKMTVAVKLKRAKTKMKFMEKGLHGGAEPSHQPLGKKKRRRSSARRGSTVRLMSMMAAAKARETAKEPPQAQDHAVDVSKFLAAIGLSEYAGRFAEFGIDTMADLADPSLLTDAELGGPDIAMDEAHIRQLRRALAEQTGGGGDAWRRRRTRRPPLSQRAGSYCSRVRGAFLNSSR